MLIIDTSVLSAFTRLGILNLFQDAVGDIFTTRLVINEFSQSFQINIPYWISIKVGEDKIQQTFPLSLSQADKSIIILSQNLGFTIATDDLNIRNYCKTHNMILVQLDY
jgi:predicted nucleic acid-binding protein